MSIPSLMQLAGGSPGPVKPKSKRKTYRFEVELRGKTYRGEWDGPSEPTEAELAGLVHEMASEDAGGPAVAPGVPAGTGTPVERAKPQKSRGRTLTEVARREFARKPKAAPVDDSGPSLALELEKRGIVDAPKAGAMRKREKEPTGPTPQDAAYIDSLPDPLKDDSWAFANPPGARRVPTGTFTAADVVRERRASALDKALSGITEGPGKIAKGLVGGIAEAAAPAMRGTPASDALGSLAQLAANDPLFNPVYGGGRLTQALSGDTGAGVEAALAAAIPLGGYGLSKLLKGLLGKSVTHAAPDLEYRPRPDFRPQEAPGYDPGEGLDLVGMTRGARLKPGTRVVHESNPKIKGIIDRDGTVWVGKNTTNGYKMGANGFVPEVPKSTSPKPPNPRPAPTGAKAAQESPEVGSKGREPWEMNKEEYGHFVGAPKPEIDLLSDSSVYQRSQMSDRARKDMLDNKRNVRQQASAKYKAAVKDWEDSVIKAVAASKVDIAKAFDTDTFAFLTDVAKRAGFDVESPFRIRNKNDALRAKYFDRLGDFLSQQPEEVLRQAALPLEVWQKTTREYWKEVFPDVSYGLTRNASKEAYNRAGDHIAAHRAAVASALSEGKPVPAEVLADYPDLAAKYADQTGVAELREAGKVPGGGMGSKKKGAVISPSPDLVTGIVESARRIWSKPVRGVAESTKNVLQGLAGNTFDRLNSLGDAGKAVGKGLARTLSVAENSTAKLGFRVREAVRANFGRIQGDKTLGDLVGKVERGEPLSARQKRVWAQIASVNKELTDDALRHGVQVERMVGELPPGIVGETVEWYDGGALKKGVVTGLTDDALQVGDETLGFGTRVYSRQLANPETYFPREIRREVLEKLKDGGSPEFAQAANYLLETGRAKTEAQARAMVKKMVYDPDVELSSPVTSRLRMSRGPTLLPDEFYNRDVLDVFERHIARASLDVAHAKVFGKQGAHLAKMLAAMPDAESARTAKGLLDDVFGAKANVVERKARGFAAGEGAYTAITKLTDIATTIIQFAQAGTSMGVLGVRPWAKAVYDVSKSLIKDRKLIDEIKLSGVIDQDVLSLQGFDDLSGALRGVTSAVLTPMRLADRALRVHGAQTGLIAVKDALRRLKVKGGKIQRDANYRFLEDFAEFTDEDIVRMKNSGMTHDDNVMAMGAGVKTQVRTRPADLHPISSTGAGRMLGRLQTYAYGQSRIFGWTVKEASKGNLVPLARLLGASAIAGEAVGDLRGMVKEWWTPGQENEHLKEGRELLEAFKRGDPGEVVEKAIGRAFNNVLAAGSFGLYEKPIDWATKPWQSDNPPAVNTLRNVWFAIAYASKSEGDFLDKVKKGGMDIGTKEIVIWRNIYRRLHEGKTFRQENPAKSKSSKPKAAIPSMRDLVR